MGPQRVMGSQKAIGDQGDLGFGGGHLELVGTVEDLEEPWGHGVQREAAGGCKGAVRGHENRRGDAGYSRGLKEVAGGSGGPQRHLLFMSSVAFISIMYVNIKKNINEKSFLQF